MARAGAAAPQPVEPPRSLRPFLRFVRLPDQALAAVRRALDDDAGFRSRVAEAGGEELGRAPWLFLQRPDGWEAELAELAGAEQARAEADREAREERTAARRLAGAEQAVERAESAAARARAEAAGAASELVEERQARRAAEAEVGRLTRRVSELEEQAAAGRRRAAESARELSRWRARVGELEAQLERAAARPAFDPTAVHAAITAAEEAVRSVRFAVAAEESRLEAAGTAPGTEEAGAAFVPASGRDDAPPAMVRPPRPRRRPAALPPAVFEDSVEAAAHLVRLPDAFVLVDGYNAAMAMWPGVVPAELRQRLVDALAELSARTGAETHVVFDGADVAGSTARAGGRVPVRVTFSPPEVEADDVIIAMVDEVAPGRPVIVVSSDRRVQEGARSRGANVVSSAQLSELLGRRAG